MPSDLTTAPTSREMALEAAKRIAQDHRNMVESLRGAISDDEAKRLFDVAPGLRYIMARYILSMKDEHDPYDDLIASGGLGHEHESVWPKVNRDQPPEAI